jgi:glyoxylase-like metal-dependent hydrolase (beta-lactamase superfamily II)
MSQSPAFATFESSSGARVQRLPVEAFPNMWANLYLVQSGDVLALIDSGSGSDTSNEDLQRGFETAGHRFSDLTHILLTHGHIDHYGGLSFLRERTQAQIGLHELDWQTISRHESRLAVMSRRLDDFLTSAGISSARRAELLDMYHFTKALYHSVPVDFTYEAHAMEVGPFKMVHVPGHCPGHVAIKLDDLVFCGDLVLEHITPHQSPEGLTPFMGVRHYLDSLSVLGRWASDARLVLNGHDDEPISDLPARIADTRQHLSGRVEQTLAAASEPRTLAEITEQVYGAMGGYNALLVIEKIGAYVEYLYQRGQLEITNFDELENGQGPVPIRYRRVDGIGSSRIVPQADGVAT